MHIFRFPFVRNKGNYSAVARRIKRKTCFLKHLAAVAFLRTFHVLEFAAYAYPLVAVEVVFLFDAVKHQIAAVFFNMAKSCVSHQSSPDELFSSDSVA